MVESLLSLAGCPGAAYAWGPVGEPPSLGRFRPQCLRRSPVPLVRAEGQAVVIEFLCPNGHRIHCSEEQAGRAARCPRCGVRFKVPQPSEVDLPASAGDGAAAESPQFSDSGVVEPPSGIQQRRPEPQIEFLCPNGHRLHGPAQLQGKPGECPECGARFRIPVYDELADEEEEKAAAEQEISLGGVAGEDDSGTARDADLLEPAAAESPSGAAARPETKVEVHPLAKLFLRLWQRKPAEAVAELRLRSGETLEVQRFSRALSQPTHGVFLVKDSDGTSTLAVVVWEAVERVLIRGVKQLPGDIAG